MIVDLIKYAVAQPAFVIHGVRKIVQGISWTEPNGLSPELQMSDLGYGKAKLTKLVNLYYNPDEVKRAREQLARRKGAEHSSVAILTRMAPKNTLGTQGHCIQSIVISEHWGTFKKHLVTADVFYRSTEAIQKFGADLILLKKIFDDVGVDPKPVRFYFANMYISAVFFPLLFRHTDGIKFMEHVRKSDPVFFPTALRGMSRYLDPHMNYNYGAVRRMRGHRDKLDRGPLDTYMLKHLGVYHKQHMHRKAKR